MVGAQNDVKADHPCQAHVAMVSEPLSVIVVLLFLDAEGHENNLVVCRVGDVWQVGSCSGGKAEVIGNDSKCRGMIAPLQVGSDKNN